MMVLHKSASLFGLVLLVGTTMPAFADDMDVVNAEKDAGQNLAAEISGGSPIGEVTTVRGQTTITRINGKVVRATTGAPIGLGDILETGANGAITVTFIDESTFSVAEGSRIAVDEFVFDPKNDEGSKPSMSILRGIFMWTSNLIGRENPDSVNRDTPVIGVGIRG
ncbi:MAG: hypothetical protein ACOYJQ_18630 [Pseudochelatococcus sp.]|jgi:hypothetical protein|uniref:hypothetical protein n=1 Tax=Pseudochelatococcus sp. TaxID=2020869 RepID=UPI003D8C059F